MKIAFFSNFLNHHQLPMCMEFTEIDGIEFTFVATEPIEKERSNMGYADMNSYPFVLRAYESKLAHEQALSLAGECDVMIFGAAPLEYLKLRMKENKLTFYFTERVLKKGYYRRFIPTTKKKINEHYLDYKDKNLYILGASAYTSFDLKLCGFDENKCFKWGYFPKIEQKDLEKLFTLKDLNQKVEILYAGRLLMWKRVMDTIKAINVLVKKGVTNFSFTIIGDGEQKPIIENYVRKNNLTNYVTILPFMSPEEVREYMDKSDIYVFSSNFFEGWGAVMNESLNSACAVVVSHSVGSAPFLINSKENGLIYKCGSVKDLASSIEKLIKDKEFRRTLSINGYKTITENWSAKMAVERLIDLIDKIKTNGDYASDGVCSIAKPIKNNWFKGETK